MMRTILGGEYRSVNGEERLYFGEDYVKINYASSGQQEAVWIVNMLFYYMLGKRKTFFIILCQKDDRRPWWGEDLLKA